MPSGSCRCKCDDGVVTAVVDLVAAVRHGLAERADERKAPQMRAYMRSAMPFRGVQTPGVRAVCAAAFAAHKLPDRPTWERAVRELWDGAAYREERYAATALTGFRDYSPYQDPAALRLYDHMVVTGAWWDHVDEIAIRRVGPILGRYHADVAPMLRAWAVDDHMWRRRTAIVAQIRAKEATDTALLTECVDANLGHPDFFIRKGIGWALREYAKTDPAWVRAFVDARRDRLSPLSVREATKHLSPTP